MVTHKETKSPSKSVLRQYNFNNIMLRENNIEDNKNVKVLLVGPTRLLYSSVNVLKKQQQMNRQEKIKKDL